MLRTALTASLLLASTATLSSAAVFSDTVGDNFDGNAHMDITSVEVTNTASDITFTITVNGSLTTDWGKYPIGISTGSGGDTALVGNPWNRAINMADGMNAWVGTWVNGGGGSEGWTYSGGAWTKNGNGTANVSGNTATYTLPLSVLGLSAGGPIRFDVYSSGGGGGDGANDASSNPGQASSGWQSQYTTPAAGGHLYNVVVPEPTSIAALAGLATVALRRRK